MHSAQVPVLRRRLLGAFAGLSVVMLSAAAVGVWAAPPPLRTASADQAQVDSVLNHRFQSEVQPFVQTYCTECHGDDEPEADLNLGAFKTIDSVVTRHSDWELVLDMLDSKEMPPKKAKHHPPLEQRQDVVDWIQAMRRNEGQKRAGDPGPVLARRLNNAEYDYTIQDLTGAPLQPAHEFPVDPANLAGFDNSGESLATSPGLVKKQLDAARSVADHLVLTTDGFEFAPHPVVADVDRDKYFVTRIINFYRRQPTDLADYFRAAWVYRYRQQLGQPQASVRDIAVREKISARYLATILSALTDHDDNFGPMATLRERWQAFPRPGTPDAETEVQSNAAALRDFVKVLREKIAPDVPNLSAPPIQVGAQTLVLWKDRQLAANRLKYDPTALQVAGTAFVKPPDAAIGVIKLPFKSTTNTTLRPGFDELNKVIQFGGKFLAPTITTGGSPLPNRQSGSRNREGDQNLIVPADPRQRAHYDAAFARFARVFPDAFYITERARVYLNANDEAKLGGRLLSAGLHSQTGYFRDDGPLYDLVLDVPEQRELDRLWREFYFYASVPQRMYTGMVWFEKTDSDYLRDGAMDAFRPEDKSILEEPRVRKLGELYLAKAVANGASPVVQQAIREHFERVNADIRRVEQQRVAAVPKQLDALASFAARAWRRPLTVAERNSVLDFYRISREQNGADHEDAMRDSVVAVLMSPRFSYRVEMLAAGNGALDPAALRLVATTAPAVRGGVAPLSDYALATRLSYFLWASMPDAELLRHAAAGDLHRDEVLLAQTRRMLQDPKVSRLATEFAGNWLDFRRFEQHNAVDRERYPAFDDALREAMFEEPLRFFVDLVQRDGPVLDFLYGDYTFVNAPLAKHYGIPAKFSGDEWQRVDGVDKYGRGGLVPMGVFLTANSPGLRTSPVKRGYWVVRRLLGEHIPPPPPKVPVLPADEKSLGNLTLRETLERHRSDPACAICHARFDTFGLALESYGAVGEQREKDFAGHPVDTRAQFPGGVSGVGLPGLRDYIRAHRQPDFIDNLTRKLLAYALGRTLLLSDDLLVEDMKAQLAAQHYRIGALLETVVMSPQFRMHRVTTDVRTADIKSTTRRAVTDGGQP